VDASGDLMFSCAHCCRTPFTASEYPEQFKLVRRNCVLCLAQVTSETFDALQRSRSLVLEPSDHRRLRSLPSFRSLLFDVLECNREIGNFPSKTRVIG
jgi:hypothetical protein